MEFKKGDTIVFTNEFIFTGEIEDEYYVFRTLEDNRTLTLSKEAAEDEVYMKELFSKNYKLVTIDNA